MERRFGHDFGRVRIHADERAAESATAVGARAYTVGRHVVFAAGEYRPWSPAGRQLIAHELTHVVQQGDQPVTRDIAVVDDEAMEREASAHSAAPGAAPVTAARSSSVAPLRRQPAEDLRPTRPPAPVRPRPSLRVIEGGLSRGPAQTAGRAGWRHFWRAVVKRFALRGAIAAALAAADGPLPFGELIDLGLAIVTIIEIVVIWDALWSEAAQIEASDRQQPAPSPQPAPQPLPQPDPARREDPRRRCQEMHPGAGVCDGFGDIEEAVIDFLMNEGYSYTDLGDCRQVGTFSAGAIDVCSGAPGIRWHCRVNATSDEVSIFGCLCCKADGTTGYEWTGPHWSHYAGSRMPRRR